MHLLFLVLLISTSWMTSHGIGGGGEVAGYQAVCYDDIGCFTDQPPWGNTLNRPTSLLPQDPAVVNTQFYLDTKAQEGQQIFYNDMASLTATTFGSGKTTRFIIHGYMDNENEGWMEEMSSSFLAAGDDNVVRVLWSGGDIRTDYALNVVNSEVVGATTGLMINNMIAAFGMSASQFHCVGHSIGAHACAYVGNDVPLGRITGLDPAGPYFEYADVVVRLDTSDASFVDVIHTDANKNGDVGVGTPQSCGHVDFWPNDGMEQPGCDQGALTSIVTGILGIITSDTRKFVACNHYRAIYFFSESIITPCPFKSYPCTDYDDFLAGNCLTCDGTNCPEMGYHANESKTYLQGANTYLETYPDSPYCGYMTYVEITLGSNTDTLDGRLYLTLLGPRGSSGLQQLGGDGSEYELRPDTTYSDVLYYTSNPGYDDFEIDYVTVYWQQKEIELGRRHISVREVSVWAGMAQKQYYFCGDDKFEMAELTDYTFYPTCF